VTNHTRRTFLLALILAGAFLSSSCHRSPPAAKRYPFTGRVISIDSQSQSALIDGDAIPGFMDAMAMAYKIKPDSTLNHLTPGDAVSAEVVILQPKSDDAAPDYWLENVKVIGHGAPAAANSSRLPAPGDDVPDFSFTNQSGKRISLQQYRGQVLLITFIYTRCPFPDFCPRMSSNFAEVYKQLGANPALTGTHLLSISFYPEHDTPKFSATTPSPWPTLTTQRFSSAGSSSLPPPQTCRKSQISSPSPSNPKVDSLPTPSAPPSSVPTAGSSSGTTAAIGKFLI
jgi:protein SCO1/2